MTREMLLSLVSGTRVKGVDKYGGQTPGECGTFSRYYEKVNRAVIEWDEYEPQRHTADGTVTAGHGWWVPTVLLELAEVFDFGDFEPNLVPGSITELLGG